MNTKYCFPKFLYFFLICLSSYAQNDSLQNLTLPENSDTIRIDALNQLSRSYLSSNSDSTIALATRASEISERIGDYKRLGTSLKNVGLGYFYKADFVNVLNYWEESLSAFEEIKDAKGTANLLSNIGAVYYQTGDNTKALENHLKAQRIAEKSGDDFRLATVLQNIGAVYEATKEFDKAESNLIQAIEICKLIEYDKGIGTAALNLGDIYMQQSEYDLAETYFNMAREYFMKTDDNYLATPVIMMGKIENLRGNYSKALAYLEQGKKISENKKTNLPLSLAYNAMGDVYINLNQPNEAIKALKNAEKIGINIGVTEDLGETYEALTRAYKLKGDFKKVATYQDSLINTNFILYDNEKNKSIANLQLSRNIEKQEDQIKILNTDNELKSEQIARAKLFRNFLLVVAILLILGIGNAIYQYNYVKKTNKIITKERNRSDKLLLNILPEETAEELKHNGLVKAKKYDSATVLFTDFVNFTGTAGSMPPEELVTTIDFYFRNFDEIIKKYNLEKIKTIGDAYMCAGGIPIEDADNVQNALKAAADIVRFVIKTSNNPPEGIKPFQIRVGLNTGPIVTGVVGSSKFQYDIWGDTVNIASRMESNSAPNKVNVSESVYEALKHDHAFEYRGELDVKNKGKMKMYFYEHSQLN